MPLNTDPEAIPDDTYNRELREFAADHPAPTIPPDLYELEDNDKAADGDPR